MPPTPPPPRRSLPLLALSVLLGACAGPSRPERPAPAENAITSLPPTPTPRLAAPARPAGTDALARWRPHFVALAEALSRIETPLVPHESADSPPPPLAPGELEPVRALLPHFQLAAGEALILPPVHGPETSFPDHYPLRQIASLRTIEARLALARGDLPQALAHARQNLAQARATFLAQEGILPLIHAVGVWQCALDAVHALARDPALPATEARALLAELQADARLATDALDRTLRGEYAHVYRVIVERMPLTDDPDLALSAVASLGMVPPEPLQPGELGLGLTRHVLLDRDATLRAYEDDLAPYLAALAHTSRHPRGLYARHTGATLGRYQTELGAFFVYASSEQELTLDLVLRARAAMEATENPLGKLLACYLTPAWETIIATTLRREAQRAALCGLLAWRLHGHPAPWEELVAAGLLPAAPADPFSEGPLRLGLGPEARVWSVYLNATDDGGTAVEGNSGQPADLVWVF